jgi:superfamily II DNA or RNA helicase
MATKLSARGYVVFKCDVDAAALRRQLTVKAVTHPDFAAAAPVVRAFKENENKLYLPRFFGLAKYGAPDVESWGEVADIRAAFKGELRPEQVPAAEAVHTALLRRGGGVLVLPCGFGKTALAIHLVCRLGVRALVIVHKQCLMDQWRERIEAFSDASVGVARGAKHTRGDITIAMLQSVVSRDYPFEGVGLVIVDEAHHIASEVFSQALPKTAAKYMLGLSATPDRKDGLTDVMKWYLGDVCYSKQRDPDPRVRVRMLRFSDPDAKTTCDGNGRPRVSTMINDLATSAERTELILGEIRSVLGDARRKVLVLSERLTLLQALHEGLGDDLSGMYVGGRKAEALDAASASRVVLGTYAMAKEGLDIPELNALVLATPMVDIEQAVGRILRRRQECEPLILDIVDMHSCFPNQARRRRAFYVENGYNVITQTPRTSGA